MKFRKIINCIEKAWRSDANERPSAEQLMLYILDGYSNDFKFENWISRAIHKYGNKNDLIILISSSGESKNMIKAAKAEKKKKFLKIITFTGFKKKNSLNRIGDLGEMKSSDPP